MRATERYRASGSAPPLLSAPGIATHIPLESNLQQLFGDRQPLAPACVLTRLPWRRHGPRSSRAAPCWQATHTTLCTPAGSPSIRRCATTGVHTVAAVALLLPAVVHKRRTEAPGGQTKHEPRLFSNEPRLVVLSSLPQGQAGAGEKQRRGQAVGPALQAHGQVAGWRRSRPHVGSHSGLGFGAAAQNAESKVR